MKIIIEVDGNTLEDMQDYLKVLNIDNELIKSVKFDK